MEKTKPQGLYDAIKAKTANGSVNEFKELLNKFGDDVKAVKTIEQALRSKMRDENVFKQDNDGYVSKTYFATKEKQGVLNQFYLDQPVENKNTLSGQFQSAVTHAELIEKIAQLENRLTKLESGGKKASHNTCS
jgi:hypothetical protein